MARQAWAWALAVLLAACGGGEGESELFQVDEARDSGADVVQADSEDSVDDASLGERVCAPGKAEACACPGGGQGAQACRDDGAGWEPCECSPGDGSGGASDAGPDAPRWWCMNSPATSGSPHACRCEWGERGYRNVDGCPALPCCYTRTHQGISVCECTDLLLNLQCSDITSGMENVVRRASCPS